MMFEVSRPASDSKREHASNLYQSMYRSIYRVLRAANGPVARHEYIAALCLSLCWLLNLGTLFLLYRKWYGRDLLSQTGRVEMMIVYLAIFVVHYFLLIRGRAEVRIARWK